MGKMGWRNTCVGGTRRLQCKGLKIHKLKIEPD
jgi:hypothetical protein